MQGFPINISMESCTGQEVRKLVRQRRKISLNIPLSPLPEIMGSCQALKYWVATEDVTQGWVEFLVVTRAWKWDKLLPHIRTLFPHGLLTVVLGIYGSFNHSGLIFINGFPALQVGWGPRRIEYFWQRKSWLSWSLTFKEWLDIRHSLQSDTWPMLSLRVSSETRST